MDVMYTPRLAVRTPLLLDHRTQTVGRCSPFSTDEIRLPEVGDVALRVGRRQHGCAPLTDGVVIQVTLRLSLSGATAGWPHLERRTL